MTDSDTQEQAAGERPFDGDGIRVFDHFDEEPDIEVAGGNDDDDGDDDGDDTKDSTEVEDEIEDEGVPPIMESSSVVEGFQNEPSPAGEEEEQEDAEGEKGTDPEGEEEKKPPLQVHQTMLFGPLVCSLCCVVLLLVVVLILALLLAKEKNNNKVAQITEPPKIITLPPIPIPSTSPTPTVMPSIFNDTDDNNNSTIEAPSMSPPTNRPTRPPQFVNTVVQQDLYQTNMQLFGVSDLLTDEELQFWRDTTQVHMTDYYDTEERMLVGSFTVHNISGTITEITGQSLSWNSSTTTNTRQRQRQRHLQEVTSSSSALQITYQLECIYKVSTFQGNLGPENEANLTTGIEPIILEKLAKEPFTQYERLYLLRLQQPPDEEDTTTTIATITTTAFDDLTSVAVEVEKVTTANGTLTENLNNNNNNNNNNSTEGTGSSNIFSP